MDLKPIINRIDVSQKNILRVCDDSKGIKDIAIIGMAVRLPKAHNLGEFWENLSCGRDCVDHIKESRKKITDNFIKYYVKGNQSYRNMAYIDRIDEFDYKFFGISHKEACLMDPNQRLFLENTWKAFEDAGYSSNMLKGSRTGVYVGYDSENEYRRMIDFFEPEFSSVAIPGNLPAMIAGRVSHTFDLKGPSILVNTTCSSSMVALHMACRALRDKECDVAVAGGVKITLVPIERGHRLGNESIDGKTRVFDACADGTGTGEGVISIILKPFNKAVEDNDNIYAIIKGSAVNHNGSGVSVTAPNFIAEEEIIVNAWKDAKIDPNTVSYIECHSIGTQLGDPIEIEGINRAFRRYTDKKQFCAVGSVKTNIGHLDSVSGLASLVKVVLSIKHKKLPPSLHFNYPNHNINFVNSSVYVNDVLRQWDDEVRRCGISAIGLTGTNCHVVLEEYVKKKYDIHKQSGTDIVLQEDAFNIFTLSAKTISSLRENISDFIIYLKKDNDERIENICYTVNTRREDYVYRIMCIAQTKEDLQAQLKEWLDKLSDNALNKYNDFSIVNETNHRQMEKLVFEYKSFKDISILKHIGNLYLEGESINWKSLYNSKCYYRVSVPSYSFDRYSCWIDFSSYENKEGMNEQKDIRLLGREDNLFTENEKIISKIIANILDLDEVNINNTFYELGGNSIMEVKLEIDLEEAGFENIIVKDLSVKEIATKDIDINYEDKGKVNEIACFNHKKEIIVFNDIFYKSCFYNALFTIMRTCGYHLDEFFINDIIEYSFNNKELISIKYNEIRRCKDILTESDVQYIGLSKVDSIVSYISDAIREKNIILLWVDPYYASIRKDVYRKKHRAHPWVITKVDAIKGLFHIYEHSNSDSLNYKEQTVSFEELKQSYESYTNIYGIDDNGFSCYLFKYEDIGASYISSDIKLKYEEYLNLHRKLLADNYTNQYLFIKHFSENIHDKNYCLKDRDKLLQSINDLINAKRIEEYRLMNVLHKEKEAQQLVSKIVGKWEIVRSLFLKFYFSNNLDEMQQNYIVQELEKITVLEDEYVKTYM